ncbi:MAG: ROK family protein [Lentisphaerae bacterium]|nr:ROK family protein [Lentisphaerota bacterium]
MTDDDRSVVSVDFGGTWLRAALVSPDGACRDVARRPTHAQRPPGQIVDDLCALIREVRGSATRLGGVALGMPTVEDEHGGLVASDNVPTLTGFPLRTTVGAAVGLPVCAFNDANCYAVGEWWQGAGRGTRNLCGITLGTGVGLGLIIEGRCHGGSHGFAGEIWNSPFDGGTVEQHACGAALERLYARRTGRAVRGHDIEARARAGEAEACQTLVAFGQSVGRVAAFLANVIDPDVIVFGGSVSQTFDLFEPGLRETFLSGAMAGARTRLTLGLLGERAALLGAARLFNTVTTGKRE